MLTCCFQFSAGEVVQVGKNVTQFKAGDRIINASGSTYAEYTEIHSSSFNRLTKLPDDISYETAVGLGAQALTAYTLAFKEYPVQKDDYLVVHAAAGGVGVILVQLLSNLGGKVIATVSSDEKASIAKKFGAQYTIDYTKENIVDRVKEITNGKGAHAVYDSVGKTVINASLESLRPFGVYINYGEASGKCDAVSITW
jgi:NADPH2:quinone reductase